MNTFWVKNILNPSWDDLHRWWGGSPSVKNLTITRDGVRSRIPGEWSNKRKGILVYGPDGELVTYANRNRIAEPEKFTVRKW